VILWGPKKRVHAERVKGGDCGANGVYRKEDESRRWKKLARWGTSESLGRNAEHNEKGFSEGASAEKVAANTSTKTFIPPLEKGEDVGEGGEGPVVAAEKKKNATLRVSWGARASNRG